MSEEPNRRKVGKKNLITWFKSNKANNFTKILMAILPAIIALLGSIYTSSTIANNITQNNKQICSLESRLPVGLDGITPVSSNTAEYDKVSFSNKSSDGEKWNFYKKDLLTDENGFYCPGTPGFPSWAMWSKDKLKANQEVSIVFSLEDKTDNNKNPTLFFSYGDKTNKKPEVYYTVNILDGDLNTIRLYPRRGQEIFARSPDDIKIDSYVTFNIAPVFSSKNTSKLIINPSLIYLVDGAKESYIPKNELVVELPFTEDNQGDGYSVGLGVSKGDCFKVISTSF
jgi:hypothetical protein